MRARAAAAAALASFGILTIGWQSGVQAVEASKVVSVTNSATPGTNGTASDGTTASSGGSASTASGAGTSTAGTSGSGTSTGSSSSSSSRTGSAGQASSSGLKNGTFTGAVESTRYGNVQVQIVVSGGKITDVQALQLTDADMRSQMISSGAAPVLRSEILQAQSANVDTVGGATCTSQGYLASLQAALNAAHA